MTKEERIAHTNALMNVLPYPRTWFDGLVDKRLEAIYKRHLPKIIENAIRQDEIAVRRRCGLPVHESEQLSLQI